MAEIKVIDLPAAGALTGAEVMLVEQGSTTSRSTAQAIADLNPEKHLGTDDLTIDQSLATRFLRTGGNLVGDVFSIQTLAGTKIIDFRGDNTITLPTGFLGIGTTSIGPGFGGHRLVIANTASGSGLLVQQSGANGEGVSVTLTATGGSTVTGFECTSSNATTVTKLGSRYDITGSSTANFAIDIVNGDVRTGTGTTNFDIGGDLATDTINFENASGTNIMTIQGDGDINAFDAAAANYVNFDHSTGILKTTASEVGNIGTAVQYAFNVFSRLSSSSGVARMHNSSGGVIFDMRQASGHGTLALKDSSGVTQAFINTQAGTIETSIKFIVNSLSGITEVVAFGGGSTGEVATLTITGGIITARTLVP